MTTKMNGHTLNVEINPTSLDLLTATEESRLLPTAADDETCEKLSLDASTSTEDGKSLLLLKYGCSNSWKLYLLALEKQPVITKSITGFGILALADMVGQIAEQSHAHATTSLQVGRMARYGLLGLCGTPFVHYYYDWLDVTLPPGQPCSRTTWLKLFIDQGLQAPLVTCFIFIFVGVVEGKNMNQIQEQLCEDYLSTLLANCTCAAACACYCQLSNTKDHVTVSHFLLSHMTGKLFVPAQIINMAFCPPPLRVLFINVVFFFWSIVLSVILHRDPQ